MHTLKVKKCIDPCKYKCVMLMLTRFVAHAFKDPLSQEPWCGVRNIFLL